MFVIVMCWCCYMYLDHLKLCVVCVKGRRYVCCSECSVVSNECDEPPPPPVCATYQCERWLIKFLL